MSRSILPQQGIVYILELDRPLGSARHSARYYCGWCTDLDARLHEHRTGRGARMLAAAVERGIGFQVVHHFPGTRADERRLKNRKSMPRIVQRLRASSSCTLPALAPARTAQAVSTLHERWCALAADCYARWQSGLASEHVYRAALHHLHRVECTRSLVASGLALYQIEWPETPALGGGQRLASTVGTINAS